jgi:hypothetical protein
MTPARVLIAALAACSLGTPALAQSGAWAAEILNIGRPATAVRQVGDEVYIEAGGWYRMADCDGQVCFQRARPPTARTPRNGIPDGTIATAPGHGIVEAWYTEPTNRYDHGILGDRIEGGALTVVDDVGRQFTITLDDTQVFEDLTPRIADINGDGSNDIVVIRTTISAGAAIAVYAIVDGALAELASIPPIGLTHRWLNIAGIADFNGDGRLDVALVKTPHIGGNLEFWTLQGGQLVLLASAAGFSNHAIGTTELGLSAVADVDGDGVADLALPDNDRTTLRIVGFAGGSLHEIAAVPLGGQIVTAIGMMELDGRPVFIVGLADGRLVLVSQTP